MFSLHNQKYEADSQAHDTAGSKSSMREKVRGIMSSERPMQEEPLSKKDNKNHTIKFCVAMKANKVELYTRW